MLYIDIETASYGKNKLDAFWYFGKTIASIKLSNGHELVLASHGSLEVFFNEDSEALEGDDAVEYANKKLFNDASIQNLSELFSLGNWLTIIEFDNNSESIEGSEAFSYYNEGIEALQKLAVLKQANIDASELFRIPTPSEDGDRAFILLQAAYQLMKKQDNSGFVLNILEQESVWDGANCDGGCLLDEIGELFEEKGIELTEEVELLPEDED